MNADVAHQESGITSPSNRFVSVVAADRTSSDNTNLSSNGVSTFHAPLVNKQEKERGNFTPPRPSESHWYVLRTTYGREHKAYDYLVAKGVSAFLPMVRAIKLVHGKRKAVTQSRLPNIFFAYGTEEELQNFVYDNVNLPFLRFCYRYYSENNKIQKTPMIIPERQMQNFRIVCAAENEDVFFSQDKIHKFTKGQLVRIVDGEFAGFVGRVARFKGQQRVGIYIDGLLTMATAYVPNAYLEKIDEEKYSS